MRITAILIFGLALFISFISSLHAVPLPGLGIKVQPIQSTLAEETFQTLLVNRALEALGYTVLPVQEVDYSVAYTSIAAGDATFLAVNWDIYEDQYNRAGGDVKFYRQGKYVEGTTQGYLIDKKTAEKYHITHIDQLKDLTIARLFDTNNDGKADLTGCNLGWSCSGTINHQIRSYGLSTTLKQNQGHYTAMIADTIARYKAGKPILYYTWTPYWVSNVLVPGRDVVWLQVPFSAMPDKAINTELASGANYGFPVSNQRIVANRKWAHANPAAAKLFAIMQLPIADINAQNMRMHRGKASEEDIRRHVAGWIKAHQATFDGWISTAARASTTAPQ